MASDSSAEFISEYPQGSIVMLAVPELIVRRVVEYAVSSARGALTEII